MSPLLPKGKRPWKDDPGHIHDSPEPSDEPLKDAGVPADHQELPGVEVPAMDSITVAQASEESRLPHGEPAPVPDLSQVKVPRALAQEIRRAMKRYPQKRSASIPALWAVQRRYGYCSPEGITQAAAVMGLTPAYLQSVASFYDLFHLEPHGKHEVLVCTNISCWLRGADDLLQAFKDSAGQADVHVSGFECLGACDIAPMASIDERYYGPLEDADAEEALRQLAGGDEVLPDKRLQDRTSAGGSGPRVGTDPRVTRHAMNKVKQKRAAASKKAAKPKAAAKRKGKS